MAVKGGRETGGSPADAGSWTPGMAVKGGRETGGIPGREMLPSGGEARLPPPPEHTTRQTPGET